MSVRKKLTLVHEHPSPLHHFPQLQEALLPCFYSFFSVSSPWGVTRVPTCLFEVKHETCQAGTMREDQGCAPKKADASVLGTRNLESQPFVLMKGKPARYTVSLMLSLPW